VIRKSQQVQASDISSRTLRRAFPVQGHSMTVVVEDALYEVTEDCPEGRLLDSALVEQMMRGIAAAVSHNISQYNPVPKRIILSRRDIGGADAGEAEASGSRRQEAAPVPPGDTADGKRPGDGAEAYAPRWTLDDVTLSSAARNHIESALTMIRHREKLFGEWGLGETLPAGRAVVLNFYGPPGTGKSMTAEALAGSLGKQVLLVSYAELESKYVGETPKNIRAVFKNAASLNAVLVFDEADSFLGKRLTQVQQASDYGVNMTRSVMLMELERFDGVVVFTTNLLQNYDDAFRRRILAQVAFAPPGEADREYIWKRHLPARLPRSTEATPACLAAAYDGVTGADIKDMVLYASALCLRQGDVEVGMEHFHQAYRYVASRYLIPEASDESMADPKQS
jgi:AAA+ superfamily predicted ATPase